MIKRIENKLGLIFLTIFATTLIYDHAPAQNSELDVSGSVKIESILSEIHDSSFIPKSPNANYADLQFLTRAIINTRYELDKFRFTSNGRMILGEGSDVANSRAGDKVGYLNELFVEYFPTISSGFFVGRRNMSFGQSRVINPSDVFNGDADTKGTEKIGAEYFGASGYTVRAIWAPGTGYLNDGKDDKFYVSYQTLFGESYTDFLMFALHSDRPRGGISVAATSESGLVSYSDIVIRQGETLPSIQFEKNNGSYAVLPTDDSAILLEATAGLNYDFVNGLSVTAEFTHLSDGYGSSEWTTFVDAISNSRSPDSLGKLIRIARNEFLRQNYVSIYLRHTDFYAEIEPELSVLLGIHDFSNNWKLGLSRDLGDYYSINLDLDRNFGRNSGEFNRGSENGTIRLSLVGRF